MPGEQNIGLVLTPKSLHSKIQQRETATEGGKQGSMGRIHDQVSPGPYSGTAKGLSEKGVSRQDLKEAALRTSGESQGSIGDKQSWRKGVIS